MVFLGLQTVRMRITASLCSSYRYESVCIRMYPYESVVETIVVWPKIRGIAAKGWQCYWLNGDGCVNSDNDGANEDDCEPVLIQSLWMRQLCFLIIKTSRYQDIAETRNRDIAIARPHGHTGHTLPHCHTLPHSATHGYAAKGWQCYRLNGGGYVESDDDQTWNLWQLTTLLNGDGYLDSDDDCIRQAGRWLDSDSRR